MDEYDEMQMQHQADLTRMGKTRKWDVRFMKLAHHIASWSKDPSTKVGSILTSNRLVLGMGYNGFPAGTNDAESLYKDRAIKYPRVVHAEMNAVINANRLLAQGEMTLYCTLYSCADCAGPIINFGVQRVVFPMPTEEERFRWGESNEIAKQMYEEAGVLVDLLA